MRAQESIPVDSATGPVTSVTLLMRLQQSPADEAAWAEFVERYGQRIHAWCRRWGLQEADAQDVTQTVLLKVIGAVQGFHYDPTQKFRAWLKTVTHHAWQDLVRSRREVAAGGEAASGDDPLQTLAARDELGARLEGAYEQELVEHALARVRPRVQPPTWEAFRLTAFEGLSGAEAAARIGMAVTSVYKAKSNVQKLLEAEVRYLEGGET
jgi:RNA polymerase sigma-70 factor (ECF subfamily)